MARDAAVGAETPGDDGLSPPEHIRRLAHVAGNGELLWPHLAAVQAANWMAQAGLAIWGGEVYSPRGPFTAVMVDEWRTIPERGEDEDWLTYVRRGQAQALRAIEAHSTSDAPLHGRGETLFFLAGQPRSGFRGE
ncbi:MAG: hypothetical protein QOK05_300 [Chloroflexota bacterium]|nr:hypothetical protein [Chloroflexota bacterium]